METQALRISNAVCLKHELSLQEMLTCLAIADKDYQVTIHNLLQREVIVRRNGQYMLTQHWSDVVDEIIAESSQECTRTDEELTELARKMREIYPQGRCPGSPYLYRCNPKEVMLQLKKFFVVYGNYDDEEILDATRRYVASFNGDYRFLKLLKYFIQKNEKELGEDGEFHVVKHSYLADFLENKEDENVITGDDWMLTSRN